MCTCHAMCIYYCILLQEYFENPAYRSDGLKLYPTLVIRGTGEFCILYMYIFICTYHIFMYKYIHTGIDPLIYVAHIDPLVYVAHIYVQHQYTCTYICFVFLGLYELWKTGRYKSYPPSVLIDLVARILALVPPWTRVYRVQRSVCLC